MLALSYETKKYIDIMHDLILWTMNVLQESCHVKIYISYYGITILLHLDISFTIFLIHMRVYVCIYIGGKTVSLLWRVLCDIIITFL